MIQVVNAVAENGLDLYALTTRGWNTNIEALARCT